MTEKISLHQLNPSNNYPDNNFAQIEEVVRESSEEGSSLCVLPEDFLFGVIRTKEALLEAGVQYEGWISKFTELAKKHSVDLVPGSLPKTVGDSVYNTTLYIDRKGAVLGEHSKVNLWLTERGEYDIGLEVPHVFDTPLGRTALLVCWDIMDHRLFEAATSAGAEWVIIPSFWINHQSETLRVTRGRPISKHPKHSEGKMLEALISTRVQEYGLGIVFCNFAGGVSYVDSLGKKIKVKAAGRSQVVAPLNSVNSKLSHSKGARLDVEIKDKKALTALRDHELFYGRREDAATGYPYKRGSS